MQICDAKKLSLSKDYRSIYSPKPTSQLDADDIVPITLGRARDCNFRKFSGAALHS